LPYEKPIILFDGVCNLCNATVQFVLTRDPAGQFTFATLQSETGRILQQAYALPVDKMDTFVLIDGENVYVRSTGALELLRRLGGGWQFLYGLKIIPQAWRDWVYNWVARNRYRLFGKREMCMMPSPDVQSRFLD
jgi:predicted DCC family thiol-disulfide oxidoreductase YuxK